VTRTNARNNDTVDLRQRPDGGHRPDRAEDLEPVSRFVTPD